MARARPPKAEAVASDAPDEEGPEIDENEDDGDESDAPGDRAGGRPMSKAKAARAAIQRGYESPQEASEFIRREYGIEMAPQHFSAVKSLMRKKERETGEAGTPARRGRRPALDSYLAPPPRQSSSGVEADLLEAMEAIKPLVASLGADKVKRIVELLG